MKNINTTDSISKRLTDSEIDKGIQEIAKELADDIRYTVILPVIEGRPSTVELCCNGYVFRIQCGVSVEVPESVYLLLLQAGRLGI